MSKPTIRLTGLLLIAVIAVASAIWPDHAVLYTMDESRIPAEVIIRTPEETYQRMTFAETLIDAIDEASIPLGEDDLLSMADNTPLEPGKTYDVVVDRRDQVRLNWSGYELGTSSTLSLSMGDLMARSGFDELESEGTGRVEQNKDDSQSVANGEIAYTQIDRKIVRTFEQIPFSTVTLDDPKQYVGETSVQTEGQEGRRIIVSEETYENGVFVGVAQRQSEVIREPVQKVILKGTKPLIPAVSRKPKNSVVAARFNEIKDLLIKNGNANYRSFKDNGNGTITVDGKTFSFIEQKKRAITMYDGLECCLQGQCHSPAFNHGTASGIPAQRGLVAAYGFRSNGKFVGTALPLGTILFIEGYGLAVVADVHGNHSDSNLLDACYDAGEIRNGSVTWGKQTKNVYIISLP